jgi:hypothetical protein
MTPQTGKSISVASISKEGFCVTAILVTMLWCILGADRLIRRGAEAKSTEARQTIEYLRMRNYVRGVESQSHPAAAEPAPKAVPPKPLPLLHEI